MIARKENGKTRFLRMTNTSLSLSIHFVIPVESRYKIIYTLNSVLKNYGFESRILHLI